MEEIKTESQRVTNYCPKHDQHYMQFLPICPVCRGELLAGLPGVPLGSLRIDEKDIPNKTGLFTDSAENPAPAPTIPVSPRQMGLFE